MTDAPALPELVDCPPMRSRMLERSCIRMWTSARDAAPRPEECRYACLTCPLGAQRAGVDVAAAVAAASAAVVDRAFGRVCPRCERPTARLINGRSCISCYNRTREAVKGANAKGTRPKIMDAIHAEALAIATGDVEPRLVTVERVVSRTEAIGIAARQAGPGAIIGIPPLRLVEPEAA
jgi:hypothetical protein